MRLLLFVFCAVISNVSNAANSECAKTKNGSLEKTICSDMQLAELYEELQNVYESKLTEFKTTAEKDRFRVTQSEWLRWLRGINSRPPISFFTYAKDRSGLLRTQLSIRIDDIKDIVPSELVGPTQEEVAERLSDSLEKLKLIVSSATDLNVSTLSSNNPAACERLWTIFYQASVPVPFYFARSQEQKNELHYQLREMARQNRLFFEEREKLLKNRSDYQREFGRSGISSKSDYDDLFDVYWEKYYEGSAFDQFRIDSSRFLLVRMPASNGALRPIFVEILFDHEGENFSLSLNAVGKLGEPLSAEIYRSTGTLDQWSGNALTVREEPELQFPPNRAGLLQVGNDISGWSLRERAESKYYKNPARLIVSPVWSKEESQEISCDFTFN